MTDAGNRTPTWPLLIFGVPFLGVGALCAYFAIKGRTFAQPLDKMSDVIVMGIVGTVFCAVGVCASVCAVAGQRRFGRAIAASLMAGHIGLLGAAFLVIGIFDPESIDVSVSAPFVGHLEWNRRFGIGAVAFVLGGMFLLSQTPRIYRTTMKQLDKATGNQDTQPSSAGDVANRAAPEK
jgi:hypothetical protein